MDVEPSGSQAEGTAAKVVYAFLICDIRGYSTFTTQRGAAAAGRLATTFTGLSRDAVAGRGGRVLGLRGDEVLAAFDSPDQAVRAGLDIQSACTEESASNPAYPLGVGAGIDFGEAVSVGDGYHGAVINMAARLCSRALAGQVLVTRTVVDATGDVDDITFELRATHDMKGFAEPVEMLEALPGARPRFLSWCPSPLRRHSRSNWRWCLLSSDATPTSAGSGASGGKLVVGRDGSCSWPARPAWAKLVSPPSWPAR